MAVAPDIVVAHWNLPPVSAGMKIVRTFLVLLIIIFAKRKSVHILDEFSKSRLLAISVGIMWDLHPAQLTSSSYKYADLN